MRISKIRKLAFARISFDLLSYYLLDSLENQIRATTAIGVAWQLGTIKRADYDRAFDMLAAIATHHKHSTAD